MPPLLSSAFCPWLPALSFIRRTAVCGPACTVVWQGRKGDLLPYADWGRRHSQQKWLDFKSGFFADPKRIGRGWPVTVAERC